MNLVITEYTDSLTKQEIWYIESTTTGEVIAEVYSSYKDAFTMAEAIGRVIGG
ncbi:MAG: hypothetical protein ACXAEN_22395 [Candidatus Thorarchaeota archaeon]|jgi:hypothetical protein